MTEGLIWVRGAEYIPYTRPSTYLCLGVRGSGKSSFLEATAERYLTHGSAILDLFGSRDGEGLAWLRSPHAQDKKILLLHGSSVDVRASVDTKKTGDLELGDFSKYDIVISSAPLYVNPSDEFDNASKVTELLYKRRHWRRLIYLVVREASNLYFSRLKIVINQTVAKSEMIYLIREARHAGVALGLDSLRYMGIDVDIRSISDYLVLKAQGLQGLSRDLFWLYSLFKPSMVQNMPKDKYLIVTKQGSVGIGRFDPVPWHKQEKEDIVADLGLKVEYGEIIEESRRSGSYNVQIGDEEHSQMIRGYAEEGLSMHRIAARFNRSSSTALMHINEHNEAIARSGFCPRCRRVKGPFDSAKITRAQAAPK